MEAGVEGDKRVRKGGSGQINEWQRKRKVTRGLRVTEVVIERRDGGRGEAEWAAAVGREEELEEDGVRGRLVGRFDRGGE